MSHTSREVTRGTYHGAMFGCAGITTLSALCMIQNGPPCRKGIRNNNLPWKTNFPETLHVLPTKLQKYPPSGKASAISDSTLTMRHSTALAVLTACIISTASAGIYYIDNYCPFPLFLISTSMPPQPDNPPLVTLPANTTNAYSEQQRNAGKSPHLREPSHPLTSAHSLQHQRPNHKPLPGHVQANASNLPPNDRGPSPRLLLLRPQHHLRRPPHGQRLRTANPTRWLRAELPAPRSRPGMPVHLRAHQPERK